LHRSPGHPEGEKQHRVVSRAQLALRTALDFWQKLNNDWFFYLAAILAYSLLMSFIPLLAVLLSVCNGILGILAPQVQQQLLNGLGKQLLPANMSSELLQPAVQAASQEAGWVGIVALLVSAWIGSRLFVAIESCFGIIFRVSNRAMVRQNLMALLMLLVFALLLPLLLAVPLGMTIISSTIASQVLVNAASIRLWLTITWMVAGFVVASAFFLVVYLVVPNRPLHLRDAWRGALIAGALLQLYNLAFPFYATHFLPFGSYGAALGLTLLILLFFYYFGTILLLGAEINAFRAGLRATATDLPGLLARVPVRNQGAGADGPTAGQSQEDVQANGLGLDHAMTSQEMDEGQERERGTGGDAR
jgi:membrane protein